jgi:hypothetical protein
MKPEGKGPKARHARKHWREEAEELTKLVGKKEAQNARTRGNRSTKRHLTPSTPTQQKGERIWVFSRRQPSKHQPTTVQPPHSGDSPEEGLLSSGSFGPKDVEPNPGITIGPKE